MTPVKKPVRPFGGGSNLSRRNFVRNSAIVGAGFFIVPRHVLGRGFIAPSDKLNIAGIGVGGKGESDLSEFAKSPFVNIVALCDVDDRESKKSRERFPKAPYYKDFREMLAKEKNNIDACSISTPDNVHAVATLAAMQLGKHVYTQKPLAHDIYEARRLTQAAEKYKVVTQMGNQGGSGDGVRKAKEMVDAGMIGKVTEAQAWTNRPVWPQGIPTPSGKFDVPKELDWNLWLGPAKQIEYNPAYLPFNWRGWWAFGTGALGDMACHIMDPIYRILPILYPDSAECSVGTVWLELNNYLTPLEQINIVTSILYSYYGLKGGETNYKEPNEFLLHKTLEAKRGNQICNGILYLVLCELLDIPVRAINIPKQFIIAYFKPGYSDESLPNPVHKIEFFIDPTSGQVFTQQDVDNYFKRIAVPPVGSYFKPQKNKQVIQQLLEEFSKCFDTDKDRYKQTELMALVKLLD